jgi:molybdopterin converting factor small subunit
MKVRIMYFGRLSDSLMMTSELMELPEEDFRLGQVLDRLRQRGISWRYELHESHLVCTVNAGAAKLTDPLQESDEIALYSRKSWLEA